jgi:hypothetical protein
MYAPKQVMRTPICNQLLTPSAAVHTLPRSDLHTCEYALAQVTSVIVEALDEWSALRTRVVVLATAPELAALDASMLLCGRLEVGEVQKCFILQVGFNSSRRRPCREHGPATIFASPSRRCAVSCVGAGSARLSTSMCCACHIE